MDISSVDDSHVRQAARGVGLDLAPEQVAGVVMYFKMIAGMAAAVNEFPLEAEAEHAAVFTPCSKPMPG